MTLILTLLASFGFLPALLPLTTRLFGGSVARRALTSVGLGAAGASLGERLFGDGDGRPRRRRRRRALTASDRADIAFIQATLGKAAADRFAQQIVAGRSL